MEHLPPCLIAAIYCHRDFFFFLTFQFLQPLEVKMMLFHFREVLHWKALPSAGIAVLIFLLEDAIPRALFVLLWGASAGAGVSKCLLAFLQVLPFGAYSGLSYTTPRERRWKGSLLIMEQLNTSFLAALGMGGVETLVSGKKRRGTNGKSWELCGTSCSSADCLSSVAVMDIRLAGRMYTPQGHSFMFKVPCPRNKVLRCWQQFCWEESLHIETQHLNKLGIKICTY